MKHSFKFSVIAVLFLALGFASCNNSDDDDNDIVPSHKTTISGIVFDENHSPKSNVEVKAHGQSFVTGSDGVFLFTNLSVPKEKCYVVVEEEGYFSCMRSRKPNLDATTRIDIHLISDVEGEYFAFPSGLDYTATLSDGSSITFASTTAFVDKNGEPYNGVVGIKAKVLDATSPLYSRYAFGGDQIGLDNDEEQFLNTYTGMMVEIFQPNGAYLQLADGTTPVEVFQVIPPAFLTKSAPNSVPVYHASLTSGYNKRRGGGTKNGGGYVLSVGHFSYWSTQEQSSQFGQLKCRVIDAGGNIVSGVRVQVGKTYGITDANGTFDISVPAGLPMDVAVLPEDFYGVGVVSSQSAWSNQEEKLVELQLPVALNRIQGQLVDCNDNPIAGQVSLVWSSYVSSVYTPSGSFELPTTVNNGDEYKLVVSTGSAEKTFFLTKGYGSENIGNVEICENTPPSSTGNNIRIYSNGEIIAEYNDFTTLTGEFSTENAGEYYRTVIRMSEPSLYISIPYCDSVGEYSSGGVNLHGEFDGATILNLQVNITSYGEVGGKIKGVAQGTLQGNKSIYVEFVVDRLEDHSYD